MFDDIEKTVKSISNQKEVRGVIIKKKAGRPRKPESGKYHIKMPITLYEEIKRESARMGGTISSFLGIAAREKLDRLKKQG